MGRIQLTQIMTVSFGTYRGMKKWVYSLRAVLATLWSTVANRTKRYLSHGPAGGLLLPVLVATAGWSFIYVIENTTSGPLVRYSVDWPLNAQPGDCLGSGKQGIGRKVVVSLHNLSIDKVIKDARFSLSSIDENAGVFSDPRIWAKPPASVVHSFTETKHERQVDFTIKGFHPAHQFKLQACYSGDDRPNFRLMISEESVFLLSGRKAYLVEHRLYIIAVVGMLSLFLIIISWWALAQVTDNA